MKVFIVFLDHGEYKVVISLHRTHEGAERAILEQKLEDAEGDVIFLYLIETRSLDE